MLNFISEFLRGLREYNTVPVKMGPQPAKIMPAVVFNVPEKTLAWKGIVWHHSATMDGTANDWESIRRYHMSWRVNGNIVSEAEYYRAATSSRNHCEKPWSDIGYHLGIEREGGILRVKLGRAWDRPGAHAGFPGNNNYNNTFLGCCVIGNFDTVPPDAETMEMCLAVTRQLMESFGIGTENVLGHREAYDRVGTPRLKNCPGIAWNLDVFRSRL